MNYSSSLEYMDRLKELCIQVMKKDIEEEADLQKRGVRLETQ